MSVIVIWQAYHNQDCNIKASYIHKTSPKFYIKWTDYWKLGPNFILTLTVWVWILVTRSKVTNKARHLTVKSSQIFCIFPPQFYLIKQNWWIFFLTNICPGITNTSAGKTLYRIHNGPLTKYTVALLNPKEVFIWLFFQVLTFATLCEPPTGVWMVLRAPYGSK